MDIVILNYLIQNPKLIYAIAIFLAVVVVYALLKGRKIKFPFVEVGEEPQEKSMTNIFNFSPGTESYTPSEVNENINQAKKRAREMTKESGVKDIQLYEPPDVPERSLYIYKAKVDIDNIIKILGISHFGAWSGSSLADVSQYLEIIEKEEIIHKSLLEDIRNFYWLIIPWRYGHEIGDEPFFDIQVLVTKIVRSLDEIPLGELGH